MHSLTELSSDIAELGRSLREIFEPLSDDNLAVSRLIGQFRQEFMELRRVPLAGLFRRLHRAARDAAHAEGKHVRLEWEGENVGLERSLQERLYEPLLHLVRNSVSHGIEPPDVRSAAGKTAEGAVTLHARADTASLVLEVRDDGRGLDYETLERRGRELGLLPAGRPPSRDQLAKLIFHAGLSTRSSVNQISGRGVGMDVVLAQVERLRGRVDVDSTPGKGTCIRLQIPLRSAIEHAMIVRVDGQLFALPMHYVQGADLAAQGRDLGGVNRRRSNHDQEAERFTPLPGKPSERNTPSDARTPLIHLRNLLGAERSAPPLYPQILMVKGPSRWEVPAEMRPAHFSGNGESKIGLVVDSVVGTEEVVVRALPPMLRPHRLLAGVTLSGEGEATLLLEIPQLVEQGLQQLTGTDASDHCDSQPSRETIPGAMAAAPRILVVDDSLSARRNVSKILQRCGYETQEASDGLHALDLMRSERFSLVVSDLEMPRLGGMELLAEIKRGRRVGHVPVVIVTSRDDSATLARARELGADAVITKPATPAAITEVLRALGNGNGAIAPFTPPIHEGQTNSQQETPAAAAR